MSYSKLAQRPHWLITKHDPSHMQVLTVGSGDGLTLPIFSFEEEARLYLRFCEVGRGWGVREISSGELFFVLSGPGADVEKVALDPIPEVCGEEFLDLLSVEREEFLEMLLEDTLLAPRPIRSGTEGFARSRPTHRTDRAVGRERRLFSL